MIRIPKILFTVLFFFQLASISNAQNNSVLWEISGNELESPSYLFGTIHISDERVFQWNDSLMICFDTCKTMAGELSMDEIDMAEVAYALKMPGDTTLKMLLSKKDYRIVKKYVRKNCGLLVRLLINKIKPIYISVLINEGDMAEKSSEDEGKNKLFLDQYLQELAKEKGMEVKGLETAIEQLNAIEIMSLEEQAQALVEEIKTHKKPKEGEDILEAMIQAYITHDLDSLYSLFIGNQFTEPLMESLIYNRNRVMLSRMIPLMHEQSTFVAVGAAHLPGEQGIIKLLRDSGYTLRPVNCKPE